MIQYIVEVTYALQHFNIVSRYLQFFIWLYMFLIKWWWIVGVSWILSPLPKDWSFGPETTLTKLAPADRIGDRPEADKPNPLGIPLKRSWPCSFPWFETCSHGRNPYLATYIAIGIPRNDWLSHFEGHRILQRSWRTFAKDVVSAICPDDSQWYPGTIEKINDDSPFGMERQV